MQNRFVLNGIPSEVRSIPGAENELMEFLEARTCWIDRFAWINDGDETIAAIELNLENVRDHAVNDLDGREILLPEKNLQFTVHAEPATRIQSTKLLEQCADNGKDCDIQSHHQTLYLSDSRGGITLRIHRSTEGGTGSEAWRGGLLLAQQICKWFDDIETQSGVGVADMENVFCGDVLELGAGSAGLPSLALAASAKKCKVSPPRSLVASDTIDEVVAMLRKNVTENNLCIDVRSIDWNNPPKPLNYADCIVFADCVYTESGAEALHNAILSLLRPGGNVLGVLPDFRVGLASFEASMLQSGFEPKELHTGNVPKTAESYFHCAGGSSNGYRTVWWTDCRAERR